MGEILIGSVWKMRIIDVGREKGRVQKENYVGERES